MDMEMTELPTEHSNRVRDRRIERVVELMPPVQILDELPLSTEQEDAVLRHRSEITSILDRSDDRLLVIVGPCSVHDVDAALEYAQLLSARASDLRAELCIAMRVYFEKPRTSIGWKGLINDPHMDGSGDVNTGLLMARGLLREVLDLGLPIGCEFLDPITPQYISDLVAWGAIGARTTESQIHRQLASGLSMPVGFKNRTDGNIKVAVDAVRAAAAKHAFAGIDHRAHVLVADREAGLDLDPAVVDVQVGAADAGRLDPDHRLVGRADLGLGLLVDADLARGLIGDGAHQPAITSPTVSTPSTIPAIVSATNSRYGAMANLPACSAASSDRPRQLP